MNDERLAQPHDENDSVSSLSGVFDRSATLGKTDLSSAAMAALDEDLQELPDALEERLFAVAEAWHNLNESDVPHEQVKASLDEFGAQYEDAKHAANIHERAVRILKSVLGLVRDETPTGNLSGRPAVYVSFRLADELTPFDPCSTQTLWTSKWVGYTGQCTEYAKRRSFAEHARGYRMLEWFEAIEEHSGQALWDAFTNEFTTVTMDACTEPSEEDAGFANPRLLAAMATTMATEFLACLAEPAQPRPSRKHVDPEPQILDDEVLIRLKPAATRGMFGSQRMVRAGPDIYLNYLNFGNCVKHGYEFPTDRARSIECSHMPFRTSGMTPAENLLGPGSLHTRRKDLLGQLVCLSRLALFRREQA